MKKILSALILVFASLMASAQITSSGNTTFFSTEKEELKPVFGIRGGLNMSTFVGEGVDDYLKDEDTKSSTKLGFNIGMSVDLPILQSFYIQSGLFLTQKGYKTKDNYSEQEYSWERKDIYKPLYLQLPILASYRYNFSEKTQLQVNFGSYLAYGIAGKYTTEWKENNRGKSESDSESVNFFGDREVDPENCFGAQRFDAGIILGAGITFNKIYAGIQWERGFNEIVKDSKIYNNNVSINIGYNF